MLIIILQTKKTFFAFVDLSLIFKSISIFILHVQFSTSIFSKIFFTFISNCFTHVRFFKIFVQFALIEIIEKFDRNELNKLK